jgi:hypothetical protein
VIGGWTESDRGRPFASLLFGAYKDKEFHWLGHAGGGFKDREMPEILRKLKKIEIKKKPFINAVEYSGRPIGSPLNSLQISSSQRSQRMVAYGNQQSFWALEQTRPRQMLDRNYLMKKRTWPKG